MAVLASHGVPSGLFVVMVIMTVLSASPAAGVYVKSKGDEFAKEGFTEPEPFSVIVTFVALPPKVLPATVTGVVVPHKLLPELLNVTDGPFIQLHNTEKPAPVVVHPKLFITVMV